MISFILVEGGIFFVFQVLGCWGLGFIGRDIFLCIFFKEGVYDGIAFQDEGYLGGNV